MGGVSVSRADSRSVQIEVSEIPAGGTVDVIRGDVDLAGPDEVDPVLSTTTLRPEAFDRSDRAALDVDTTASRFVRVVVKTAAGLPVGFSNPVWLLRERPPHEIPPARLS
jgi:hypothetical protein